LKWMLKILVIVLWTKHFELVLALGFNILETALC
jgi:hypothetical protein